MKRTCNKKGSRTKFQQLSPEILNILTTLNAPPRFARTHARWQQEPVIQLEDILVAFADTIWKGKRGAVLEQEIAQQIARRTHEEVWSVYMKLDDIANKLAADAHERIIWQGKS